MTGRGRNKENAQAEEKKDGTMPIHYYITSVFCKRW
jgi:hypothetical protein